MHVKEKIHFGVINSLKASHNKGVMNEGGKMIDNMGVVMTFDYISCDTVLLFTRTFFWTFESGKTSHSSRVPV